MGQYPRISRIEYYTVRKCVSVNTDSWRTSDLTIYLFKYSYPFLDKTDLLLIHSVIFNHTKSYFI